MDWNNQNDDQKKDAVVSGIITNNIFQLFASLSSIWGIFLAIFLDNIFVRAVAILLFGGAGLLLIKLVYQRKTSKMDKMIANYNAYIKNCYADINNGKIKTYEQLSSLLSDLSTCIEEVLNKRLQKKVSICMKIIETESILNEDSGEWKVKAIARSKSTASNRIKKDAVPMYIRENSELFDIITGIDGRSLDFFAAPDLVKLIKKRKEAGHEYKNSIINYLEDYKSTIVCPIRIKTDLMSEVLKGIKPEVSADYHLLGFLCLDSQHQFRNHIKFIKVIELMEAFADSLYPLLEVYLVSNLIFLSNSISGNEKLHTEVETLLNSFSANLSSLLGKYDIVEHNHQI